MRTPILLLLFSILYTFALARLNSASSPFFAPFFDSDAPAVIQSNETIAHELLKRQTPSNACPSTYKSCSGLGAPGLCCPSNTNCSPDMAGHVACCPSGAACTGTIGAVNTGGTTSTSSGLAGVVTSTTTTSAGNGLVLASTSATSNLGQTTTQGFIIAASSTVATGVSGAGSLAEVGILTYQG
ncbi:hypothetical protein BJ546DRAFT_96044 [Cryomyces antarcticus]